jgi:hypothetical protein
MSTPEYDREYSRQYRLSHREHIRQRDRNYHKRNSELRNKNMGEWRELNPEKIVANNRARIIPIKYRCESCGTKAEVRHHPDYNKPLYVVHLCRACHAKAHSQFYGGDYGVIAG